MSRTYENAAVLTGASRQSTGFAVGLAPVLLLGAASIAVLALGARWSLIASAVLFGWTQIGGRCGTAHVNTMKLLSQLSAGLWARALAAYSLSGLLSATLVGLTLGAVGTMSPYAGTRGSIAVVVVLAALLALREAGLLAFTLPQYDCQTERAWAYEFGWIVAASMWGFHIGLGFATVITYGGFWVLVASILALGDPTFGALLMAAYWIGRALPLWFAHTLPGGVLLDSQVMYRRFRGANALGLVWMCVPLAALWAA